MDLATNSNGADLLDGASFVRAVGTQLGAGGGSVPVLVLCVPAFAQRAWQSGKASARRLERRTAQAFRAASRSALRDGDAIGHDRDSDWFAIAMLEPARSGTARAAIDVRAALERIATAVRAACALEVQTGWCEVGGARQTALSMDAIIDSALERGARERERYEFFATVGHELRTPLTSIRGYLETLLEQNIDPNTMRRFLEIARHEALRLGRLVDGMLEFSLLDLSASTSLCATAGVCEQIEAACAALAPVAADRGIELHFVTSEPVHARLPDDVLMHVLINLLENAIKHGRSGGRVEVSSRLHDGCVEVTVDDDGPGITLEDRSRIFGIRERGARAGTPGSGIGLSIVKTIAERAGGDVRARTSILGGSQFVFRVPAATAAGAESRARSS
ncbi:MAG: sensor histidine kinase [Vulcanimicrobiaceae bacterium]